MKNSDMSDRHWPGFSQKGGNFLVCPEGKRETNRYVHLYRMHRNRARQKASEKSEKDSRQSSANILSNRNHLSQPQAAHEFLRSFGGAIATGYV